MKPTRVPEEGEIHAEQLEVRSSADKAWYYAAVEVLVDRIHIRFVEFDEGDDEFWDISDLRKHAGNIGNVIRLSSLQLQDEDCRSVVEGMTVCARHVEDKGDEVEEEVKYYDARITKVDRNPHNFVGGEEICTCVFEVYWTTGPGRKKFGSFHSSAFLSCGDICVLHPGNAELHPIVKNILRLVDGGSRPYPHTRPVASEQLEKSYAEGRLSGSSRSREASNSEGRPLASSKQSGRSDCNARMTGSMLRSTSSSADREGCSVQISEQSRESVSASTAGEAEAEVESDKEEERRSVVSISSDDHSTSMSSPVVRKVNKLDEVKEYTHPITLKAGKVANLSSGRATSKPPVKRMRGAVDEWPSWHGRNGGPRCMFSEIRQHCCGE